MNTFETLTFEEIKQLLEGQPRLTLPPQTEQEFKNNYARDISKEIWMLCPYGCAATIKTDGSDNHEREFHRARYEQMRGRLEVERNG